MERVVFKMKLKHGAEAEYERRHREIWPNLLALLQQNGIENYEIFLDHETDLLIAVQDIDKSKLTNLADQTIMQQWWDYMADLMETNPDRSPVVVGLQKVFSMPPSSGSSNH